MDEPGFRTKALSECKIAVWGMGLMGGSFALAVGRKCKQVVGIDRDQATVDLALRRGIVSQASVDPGSVLQGVDLIVLAAPVMAILEILDRLPVVCPAGAVVIDLGSTKRKIVAAMSALPSQFEPVGGHPMCGKETAGLEQADGDLYKNAPFALVSACQTSHAARRLAEDAVLAVGACPIWIGAEAHDRHVASTSHLPFLAASVLAGITPPECAPMVGPGFRSTARLAGGGLSGNRMMLDVLRTNTDNIREMLGQFQDALQKIDLLLEAGDYESLAESLQHNSRRYYQLIEGEEA